MLDSANKSFAQVYSFQAAVDSRAQIVLAVRLTQQATDVQQLIPVIKAIQKNVGIPLNVISEDAGHFSDINVSSDVEKDVELCIPPDKQKRDDQIPSLGNSPARANQHKKCVRNYRMRANESYFLGAKKL